MDDLALDPDTLPGASQFLLAEQRNARATVIGSLGDDPEKAARAQELAEATGAHPALVHANLENFEAQHKAALTSELLKNNSYLQEYVNSHPLAASVSNDDFGQLDAVSQKVQQIHAPASILSKAIEGWNEGVGEGGLGQWMLSSPGGAEFVAQHRLSAATLSVLGSPIEVPFRTIGGVIGAATKASAQTYASITGDQAGADKAGEVVQGVLMDPAIGVMLHALPHPPPAELNALARQAQKTAKTVKPYVDAGVEPPVGVDALVDQAKQKQAEVDGDNLKEALKESSASATRERSPELFANFVRQHTDAKIGILADAIRELYGDKQPTLEDSLLGWVPNIAEQLRLAEAHGGDVEVPLADWLAHVEPQVANKLHDNIRVRAGGMTLEEAKEIKPIKAEGEAIQALAEEDTENIVGAAVQYMGQTFTGPTHIDAISTAAKALGTTFDEVSENTINKIGFVTNKERFVDKIEAAAIADKADQIKQNPVTTRGQRLVYGLDSADLIHSVRQSAVLKTLEETVNDRKVTLQKVDQAGDSHAFDLLDELDKPIGELHITVEDGGKKLYVDHIAAYTKGMTTEDANARSNTFGPRAMRDLLQQIRIQFPNAEAILGDRVSGARDKADTYKTHGRVEITLKTLARLSDDEIKNFFYEKKGEQLYNYTGTDVYYRLKDLPSKTEKALADAAEKVLNRIAPKGVELQATSGIVVGEKRARGLHLTFSDRLPMIMLSLDPKLRDFNPDRTIRHEGGHHLRQLGFFDESEWKVLEKAAEDGDWLKKRGFDKLYGHLPKAGQLEEAIVEEYARRYADNPDRLPESRIRSPLDTIFEKMHSILRQIRQAIKQALGKEPSVEDLFEKVESGEIGSREGRKPLDPNAAHAEIDDKEPKLPATEADAKAFAAEREQGYGYTPSQMRQLLSEEQESIINMWHEVKEGASEGASEHHKSVLKAYAKELDKAGILQARTEDEALSILFEKRGERVKASRPEKLDVESVRQPTNLLVKPTTDLEGQGELDITRQEDKEMFAKASAIGMTVKQYQKYLELIAKRDTEDMAAAAKANEKEITRRQTKEWKEAAGRIREEVKPDILQRPDIASDEFLRTGVLHGEKLKGRPRLDSTKLTPEQRAALPDDYYTPGGMHPDDVAGLFGYASGDAMIARLAQLNKTREESGLGPKAYVNQLVEAEVDQRMQKEFGDLAQNILEEAKDHVISQTQMDLLHEETLALGMKAKGGAKNDRLIMLDRLIQMSEHQKGRFDVTVNDPDEVKRQPKDTIDHYIEQSKLLGEAIEKYKKEQNEILKSTKNIGFSITKDDLKGQVKDEFAKLPVGGISTDKYLANAGRAGTLAERALLEEKPSDAFKYKQQQYISMLLANEAKRLEKERKGFDKNAKTFSKREVPSVQQDYTNFIHDILGRVGQVVRRSVQDLQESIARGEQNNLKDFVNFKEQHDLRELPVADFLYDPAFRKPLDELTVDQFRAVNDSIKALITNGRDEQKIVRAGEAADLAVVKGKMINELKTFPEQKREVIEGKLDKLKHIARTYLASHLQLESLFNRWDRGDPQGTWTQYVMRDLAVAANYEASLEKKYSRLVAENADKVDLKEKIDNTVFYDPFTFEKDAKGVSRPTANSILLQFDRKNLRAILQNVGNASNMDKLARGYGVKPEAIMSWLHQHATKEDWDWAQKQGDIFEEINKEAATMYRGLTGIEPEKIEIKPIQTPHGAYAGWYHPVVYDPVWEGQSKKLIGGSALEEDNYVRATTPRGYTKQRTGYAAPLSLYLDQTPVRMKQMLHDIAFRPAVINASKIFYDKEVRAAIAQHYGVEYRDLLVPWLRDVANSGNYRSDAAKVGTMVSEFMRQNIIATLIGFNPGTVMKHGPTAAMNSITEVGPINFLKAVKGLTEVNEATGESNWSFAMDTSEELARRHRHYIETLRGSSEKVLRKQSFRDTMIKLGAYPVAMSDLLSAVPTWLAQYEASMKAGEDHGSSIFMADRAVRRAHGSSVITNRPALMRGGPMAQWVSSLYGFFSHILNRQYELAWRAGDTLGLVKEGEYGKAAENVPRLSAMFFSYVIFPALIEELVTPMTNDEKESWGKKAAKGLVRGMASSWIGIRDIAQAALSGHDPAAGLMATTAKAATDLYRDLSKGKETFSKQHAGNIIQHALTAFGALTGLTNAQEGRTGKFIYNYATGQEKPKGVGDWWHGLRTGTMKERKR